jgi:hypothetical protein
MTTATIIVLSDPNGGEEALGRVFNALAAAYDFKRLQRPVQVVFQGTGTRWPSVLSKHDHPVNALYRAVADTIAGASAGCVAAFAARDDVEPAGISLITGNAVPGTAGLPSVARYTSDGPVLTF